MNVLQQAPTMLGGPLALAAQLHSHRSESRRLLVVVDSEGREVDIKLFDGDLIAHGVGPCAVQLSDRAATALARFSLQATSDQQRDGGDLDVTLAITWAIVVEQGVAQLDVAGTAYVFHPFETRPEEFKAIRRDPLNQFAVPGAPVAGEQVQGPEEAAPEADVQPRRWRLPSPKHLPSAPRWPAGWPEPRRLPRAALAAVTSRVRAVRGLQSPQRCV